MESLKGNLKELLEKFQQIIIPDIQRDYVMGSGGEKLEKLLNAMCEKAKSKEKFHFNCLIGYENEKDKKLYIYDGQQRLTTLVYLCAYLCKEKKEREELQKFQFVKRETANDWLKNTDKICSSNAVDFTTYSLKALIETFKDKYQTKISFDFLYEQVIFDLILVPEMREAEQFFLDVNDGLDLKDYEIYKAELFHCAKEKLGDKEFKKFALKWENKWLKFFFDLKRKSYKERCEEELFVLFLQYCFRMMWIEKNGNDEDYELDKVQWIEKEQFYYAEKILDKMIPNVENVDIDERPDIPWISGNTHWRLSYTHSVSSEEDEIYRYYNDMVRKFLNHLPEVQQTKKDVLVWCYLSQLSKKTQDEKFNVWSRVCHFYLRMVKKILNHDRKENRAAFIRHGKAADIYSHKINYFRYFVKGIPYYYLKDSLEKIEEDELKEIKNKEAKIYIDFKKRLFENVESDSNDFLNDLVQVNKNIDLNELGKIDMKLIDEYFISNLKTHIDNYFLKQSVNKEDSKIKILEKLKKIVEKQELILKSNKRDKILDIEDLPFINGLADNFLEYVENSCDEDSILKEIWNIQKQPIDDYKEILKFIQKYNLDLDKIVVRNCCIFYKNCDNNLKKKEGIYLIPHTWCDLFTKVGQEKAFDDKEESFQNPLEILPDGWLNESWNIVQPIDNWTLNGEVDSHYNNRPKGFATGDKYMTFLNLKDIKEGWSYVWWDEASQQCEKKSFDDSGDEVIGRVRISEKEMNEIKKKCEKEHSCIYYAGYRYYGKEMWSMARNVVLWKLFAKLENDKKLEAVAQGETIKFFKYNDTWFAYLK